MPAESNLHIAETTGSKTQVIFVYDKKTKELKEIDRVNVPCEITPATTVTTVDVYGQIVVKTNYISGIALTYPSVSVVFAQIETNYGVAISKAFKPIELKEQTDFAKYKLISEINGKLAEVMAIKTNNKIKALGSDLVTSTQTQQSISQKSITTAESLPFTSRHDCNTSQMVTNIVKFIKSTPSVTIDSIKTIINA